MASVAADDHLGARGDGGLDLVDDLLALGAETIGPMSVFESVGSPTTSPPV